MDSKVDTRRPMSPGEIEEFIYLGFDTLDVEKIED